MDDATDANGMTAAVSERIDAWRRLHADNRGADVFAPMAQSGLFDVGIPGGAAGALDSYAAIACAEEALARETGQLGLASAFAARQMTARYFIGGFAQDSLKQSLLPRIARGESWVSVAISEPGAGAHPKRLQSRAERDGDDVIINGHKAWVTNGPLSDHWLVLAITAEQEGRKRFGLFLVPRSAEGVEVLPMAAIAALHPSEHCELKFTDCRVPASSMIGTMDDAYPAIAMPFRDVEDTIGTANTSGMLSWLLARTASLIPQTDEIAERLGALAGKVSLVRATSRAAIAALDGTADPEPAHTIGIRLLSREIVDEIRKLSIEHRVADAATERALGAFDLLASVAREPRRIRQLRLGMSLWSVNA